MTITPKFRDYLIDVLDPVHISLDDFLTNDAYVILERPPYGGLFSYSKKDIEHEIEILEDAGEIVDFL